MNVLILLFVARAFAERITNTNLTSLFGCENIWFSRMNCYHRLKTSQYLPNVQHCLLVHTANTTGMNMFRSFQLTCITKLTDVVKDFFWHSTQWPLWKCQSQNNEGALKRQLLIPCDLYNIISRCLDSEGGYILVKGACKETNTLIFNIINKHSVL